MIKFDDFLNEGANIFLENPAEPAVQFTVRLFAYRLPIAKIVANRHTEFACIIDLIEKTDKEIKDTGDNMGLVRESEEIFEYVKNDSFQKDTDYLALLAAYTGFMDRFENTQDNDANAVLTILDRIDDEAVGLQAISLVCVGMWFADYRGYQQLVIKKANEMSKTGTAVGRDQSYSATAEGTRVKAERNIPADMIRMTVAEEMTRKDVEKINSSSFQYYSFTAWEEMMGEADASWCTQDGGSLRDMIGYGRMRFMELFGTFNDKTGGALAEIYNKVHDIAKAKASTINRDFDMSVTYQELYEEEKTVEVPREVKKGLFRKETVYERQTQKVLSYKPKTVRFSAWRLAHFERIYRFAGNDSMNGYTIYNNWDYCLGDDGELYHITSSFTNWDSTKGANSPDFNYSIRGLIPFDNCLLQNKNQHLFIAIIHGLFYVLDDIPMGYNESFTLRDGAESYTYNFPLQLNDKNHAYQPGEGMLARLNSL